ncbi:MAG: transcriptional repressor LexA [Firmicutes bacterium]|nr:transcriptional repressor LexA [Bacillota bacterium]
MAEDLTPRQTQILQFIKRCVQEKGYPPSVREICRAVGLSSTSTVHGHLDKIEQKGLIKRDPTKPRTIEITGSKHPAKRLVDVPLLGRVTAGQPILAVQNVEDTFPLPTDLIESEEAFLLSVKGDSMIGSGILDGDHVLVRPQDTAENGDIVVALIGDDATVKKFFREADHVRLQPDNPAMTPIITRDVRIIGKVIGLFRRY